MTSNGTSKSANSKHTNVAKSEYQRQYVRGIIHNLSLQRWTSQEISDYLRDEKKIDVARSTVNNTRRQIEKQAEKWYIELRQSRYKFIAIYKERIDSLLSYQKKLHQIIDFYIQPPNQMVNTDTVIRAISELHKIEVSIFSLWKELPDLPIGGKNEPSAAASTTMTPDPRPTTFPTIPDPNHPGKWLTDPDWIEENAKKMRENSNIEEYKNSPYRRDSA